MNINRPTLLVDEAKVRRNILRMSQKARESGLALRPHFKTHQSAPIGRLFAEAGIEKATVSSVDMAHYFAQEGWKDITIAFPFNPLEAGKINILAGSITVNLLIESAEALRLLDELVTVPVSYFLKIDVGTHRTGIDPENTALVREIAGFASRKHVLKGLLAHAGHSYTLMDKPKATKIFHEALDAFGKVSQATGREDLLFSYGDTPTCTLLDSFPGMDELRPGNFVFYDIMQHSFGVCALDDIAVCLVCPVVSVHPLRNEAVVYGGAVHLSKDFVSLDGERTFGTVVAVSDEGWLTAPLARVERLSQEHGIIKGDSSFINSLKPGDLVGILPVHSCLTADLQGYYISLGGQHLEKFNKASV